MDRRVFGQKVGLGQLSLGTDETIDRIGRPREGESFARNTREGRARDLEANPLSEISENIGSGHAQSPALVKESEFELDRRRDIEGALINESLSAAAQVFNPSRVEPGDDVCIEVERRLHGLSEPR